MVYTETVKKFSVIPVIVISIPVGLLFLFFLSVGMYRSARYYQSPGSESVRRYVDAESTRLYNERNLLFLLINSTVFRNGDKYIYRPPRIVRAVTMRGQYGYGMYGMVDSWDPKTRLLTIQSYLGKKMIVRFDPSRDRTFAFIPELDRWGNVKSLPDSTHVGDVEDAGYAELFCTSDIVFILAETKDALLSGTVENPVIPREIRLSQRICTK